MCFGADRGGREAVPGCVSRAARASRAEADRALCSPVKPTPGFFFFKPSFRGAEPFPRPSTPCPGWEEASCLNSHITDPSAVGIQLVRPRRSGRVAPRTRCRAATRVVANALASKEAPLGLHWQPPALGLPQACPCDAHRSPPDLRVNHGHVRRDGPPGVHLRLRRRADGRRPHREGDADV